MLSGVRTADGSPIKAACPEGHSGFVFIWNTEKYTELSSATKIFFNVFITFMNDSMNVIEDKEIIVNIIGNSKISYTTIILNCTIKWIKYDEVLDETLPDQGYKICFR